VRFVDLGPHISVDGHFTATMDGMQIREGEGIHFTTAGGVLPRPWLLPALASAGIHIGQCAQADSQPGGPLAAVTMP